MIVRHSETWFVWVLVHTACKGTQKGNLGIPQVLPSLCFETGSLIGLIRWGRLAGKPRHWNYSASHPSWLFYMGSRDQMHVLILYFKHLINRAILLSLSVFSFLSLLWSP